MQKRSLKLLIGAALLAALATPPAAHAAQGSTRSYEDITRGAAELRKLAARALPSNFTPEMKAGYTNGNSSFKSPEAKARQQEANNILQALQ
jgi:hypothetical protein